MFAKACQIAQEFTKPLVVAHRCFDETVGCGCGTGVVLNKDGWFLTCAHNIAPIWKNNQDADAILQFRLKKLTNGYRSDPALRADPKWITHVMTHFPGLDWRVEQWWFDFTKDLAIGRLQNFEPSMVKDYPTFKNPSSPFSAGRSLCCLGFPFTGAAAEFHEYPERWELKLPLPLASFPIDGMFTRLIHPKEGEQGALLIETSSPGLRGQSGGPIFEVEGTVWGIQSRTQSLPLGLGENQFLHVGKGVHSAEIKTFLDKHGVVCAWSS